MLAAVQVLFDDADRRAGVRDREREVRSLSGHDLRKPAALALAPDAQAVRVDLGKIGEFAQDRDRLVGAIDEGVPAPVTGRRAAARLVEGVRRDAPLDERGPDRHEVALGVPIRRPRALQHEHDGT